MSLERAKPPRDLSNLQRWLGEWSAAEGVTTGRIQRRVGVLVVAAMLDDIRDNDGNHRFVAKGGAALEMRFGARARTSKDFDTLYCGAMEEALDQVSAGVGSGWQGFTGRVTRIADVDVPGLAVQPKRFEIKLAYKGRAFVTIPMEVSRPEGDALTQIDAVQVSLAPVGLDAPPVVPCLSVRYQIAQKLHACTDPLNGDRPNERAHDLADLILLEELLGEADLAAARRACVDVFGVRNKHAWPPALVPDDYWYELWRRIVEDDQFPVTDLDDAVERVRALIARIDAARG